MSESKEIVSPESHNYRDFSSGTIRSGVEQFYYNQHSTQTYQLAGDKLKHYDQLNHACMDIWECLALLDKIVDNSDPDTQNSQLQHALQTAEAIRKVYGNDPSMDWFPLTGLIHDLGKILSSNSNGFNEPQHLVVGDTFAVGCRFDPSNVYYSYFENNPDFHNPLYNSDLGVYTEHCGLDSVRMSFGHDEYLYRVLKGNKQCKLPEAALYMIRFHSFYPWHKHDKYRNLTNEKDQQNLQWVLEFNKYDLYSKTNSLVDVINVKPYYTALIDKYLPGKLNW